MVARKSPDVDQLDQELKADGVPVLLERKGVARLLRRSVGHVRNLTSRGALKANGPGPPLYRRREIARYLAGHR